MKSSEKINKDYLICAAAIAMCVFSYGFEKVLELNITPTRQAGLVLAMVYTALFGVVIVALTHCNNPYFGLLASLIAYKMMPVSITFLGSVSFDGSILYYLVRKVAALIFIILVYKFYNMQPDPKKIAALPLLAMIFAVPFFKETGIYLTSYFQAKTGSMMLGFFSQYLCYALASGMILMLAFISSYDSMRFARDFELMALSINIVRYAGKIAVYNHFGYHVSKSLYFWIVVYALIAIVFIAATMIKKKMTPKTE